MSIRLSERGVGNLLILCMVLTFCNSVAMAWFLMAYMPARAEADRQMADLLHMTHEDWQRRNTRFVPEGR